MVFTKQYAITPSGGERREFKKGEKFPYQSLQLARHLYQKGIIEPKPKTPSKMTAFDTAVTSDMPNVLPAVRVDVEDSGVGNRWGEEKPAQA